MLGAGDDADDACAEDAGSDDVCDGGACVAGRGADAGGADAGGPVDDLVNNELESDDAAAARPTSRTGVVSGVSDRALVAD